MRSLVRSSWLLGALTNVLLAGCATKQDITRLEEPSRPKQVCIVEDDKVFSGVLEAIQEGFSNHGINTRVVKGTYEDKHAAWHPHFSRADVASCDALLFYVANWSWDLAYYMYFANIWMTTGDGTKRLAQATYDASHNVGFGKFIVARTKVLELVDQMLSGISPTQARPASASPVAPSAQSSLLPASHKPDAKTRLEQLDELHKKGLISDAEYQAKRRAILDQL